MAAQKADRAASLLCWADDRATESVVDPFIGLATHKTRCPGLTDLTPGELRFVKFHHAVYLRAFAPTSKFEIAKCDRYSGDGEWGAKIVAKSFIHAGEVLNDLCGTLKTVTAAFIVPGINDFSIVNSSLKATQRLWLGPAFYVNHDCNNNSVIHSVEQDLACVKAIYDISPGDEITVHYGSDYFGSNECQCQTCEKRKVVYFCFSI